jgi:hypothetical protein
MSYEECVISALLAREQDMPDELLPLTVTNQAAYWVDSEGLGQFWS